MSKIFRSIYSLVACVAAAVSESKKAVSAVAAAVVGIGLFFSPIESAQVQFSGSGMPTVTQVDLDSFSFTSSGSLGVTLSLDFTYSFLFVPKFYWSGIYTSRNLLGWEWFSVTGTREDNLAFRTSVSPGTVTDYYYPGNRGDYYVCKFGPIDFDSPNF